MLVIFGTPSLIRVAFIHRLFDEPDGARKMHHRMVPALGGVILLIAIVLGFSFSGTAEQVKWFPYLLGTLIGLFFIGLKDDLVGLSPYKSLFSKSCCPRWSFWRLLG